MSNLETPFDYARKEGQLIWQTLTGNRRIGQDQRRDRAGNIVGTGNLAKSSRTGTEQDPIDTGIASEGTGGSAPRTYTARTKYMEYLDHVSHLKRLERTATREGTKLTFSRRQDLLDYSATAALVNDYQNANTRCDQGEASSCRLAGRGDAPTEYASPFRGSQHFDDVAYFGAGGRSRIIPAGETAVSVTPEGTVIPTVPPRPPPPEPGPPRPTVPGVLGPELGPPEPPPGGAPAPTVEDRDRAYPRPAPAPAPAPPDMSDIDIPHVEDPTERTGEQVPATHDRHNDQQHRSAESGGGIHSGQSGHKSHTGSEEVVSFDSGAGARGLTSRENPVKEMMSLLNALKDPYGEMRVCQTEKKLVE